MLTYKKSWNNNKQRNCKHRKRRRRVVASGHTHTHTHNCHIVNSNIKVKVSIDMVERMNQWPLGESSKEINLSTNAAHLWSCSFFDSDTQLSLQKFLFILTDDPVLLFFISEKKLFNLFKLF